jgi:putative two-component system response regulator
MNGKKQTILLIDDDEIHLAFIESILKTEYEMVKTKSGAEALDYLYGGSVPDLILLDILMPQMDGWETFNRIRAICALQDVPVIFLTSVEEIKEAERARVMGAADYITKPFRIRALKEKIKNVIGQIDKQNGGQNGDT